MKVKASSNIAQFDILIKNWTIFSISLQNIRVLLNITIIPSYKLILQSISLTIMLNFFFVSFGKQNSS